MSAMSGPLGGGRSVATRSPLPEYPVMWKHTTFQSKNQIFCFGDKDNTRISPVAPRLLAQLRMVYQSFDPSHQLHSIRYTQVLWHTQFLPQTQYTKPMAHQLVLSLRGSDITDAHLIL